MVLVEMRSMLALLFVGFASAANAMASPQRCAVADQIRVTLNAVEYRIASDLQPNFSPEDAVRTEDVIPNGRRRTQYCQSASDKPAIVTRISFSRESLATWSAKHSAEARVTNIDPLKITKGTSNAPLSIFTGGELTNDGLYRRIGDKSRSELASIHPMFLGARAQAICLQFPTQHQKSDWCLITTQLPDGAIVSFGLLTAQHPQESWPALLKAIETFIATLTSAGRN